MDTIPNRQYTKEFQDVVAKQVLEGGESLVEVARRFEMPAKTLGNWVQRVRQWHP